MQTTFSKLIRKVDLGNHETLTFSIIQYERGRTFFQIERKYRGKRSWINLPVEVLRPVSEAISSSEELMAIIESQRLDRLKR